MLGSGLPNKGEIPCVSNNIKDLEDKSASLHKNPSVYDNVELIPDKDEQRNSENDTSSSNVCFKEAVKRTYNTVMLINSSRCLYFLKMVERR